MNNMMIAKNNEMNKIDTIATRLNAAIKFQKAYKRAIELSIKALFWAASIIYTYASLYFLVCVVCLWAGHYTGNSMFYQWMVDLKISMATYAADVWALACREFVEIHKFLFKVVDLYVYLFKQIF